MLLSDRPATPAFSSALFQAANRKVLTLIKFPGNSEHGPRVANQQTRASGPGVQTT